MNQVQHTGISPSPGWKAKQQTAFIFIFLNISGSLTVTRKAVYGMPVCVPACIFFPSRNSECFDNGAHPCKSVLTVSWKWSVKKTSISVAHIGLNWKWIYAIVISGKWFNTIHWFNVYCIFMFRIEFFPFCFAFWLTYCDVLIANNVCFESKITWIQFRWVLQNFWLITCDTCE